jgi:hypothetical protein
VDVSFLRLPQPAAAYTAEEGRFQRLAVDVHASGFMDVRKKYLVYYDGPVDVVKACGTAYRGPTTSGGGYSVATVSLARGYRGAATTSGGAASRRRRPRRPQTAGTPSSAPSHAMRPAGREAPPSASGT